MVGPGAIRGTTSQHYPMEYHLKWETANGCDCINFVREYVELKFVVGTPLRQRVSVNLYNLIAFTHYSR